MTTQDDLPAQRIEWRKEDKNLYLPKQKPELITIPKQTFFMVSGTGNPNTGTTFAENIGFSTRCPTESA